jgi:hypothetical protein
MHTPAVGHRGEMFASNPGQLLVLSEHYGPPADERDAAFQPARCNRCGATVLIAKFSPQHTSVQWSMASIRACAEFTARIAA